MNIVHVYLFCNIIRFYFLLIQTKNIILKYFQKYEYAIKDKKILNTINEDLKLDKSDDESDE